VHTTVAIAFCFVLVALVINGEFVSRRTQKLGDALLRASGVDPVAAHAQLRREGSWLAWLVQDIVHFLGRPLLGAIWLFVSETTRVVIVLRANADAIDWMADRDVVSLSQQRSYVNAMVWWFTFKTGETPTIRV